ncbi:Aim45p NDAI_0B02220 [Naumovozyma dairenensis CBS 421]|uniref:Probable electron transfer flavoprotein subunit alpha n=1 Tax=Naumovozyma dairenensis (strain ATCC 10597 / BCRC 20456 / CBS 421 / NBRC 0211 / NRRL Y-12639) TaxID=1071378 RepID=G0W646_NAUDC|nr:hypothetical protein NDAI_0B02220 [Naumovozyma dairenensis CBS 421]CCD23257.1 hypothetical protein NDAI_0B02220 [Naumovozyma dairenensis CBS 421]
MMLFLRTLPGIRGHTITLGKIRFSSTLAFIEATRDGKVSIPSMSAIHAAQKLKNPITAIIIGSHAPGIAKQLQSSSTDLGLQEILVAEDATLNTYLPEVVTPLLQNVLGTVDKYTHFVMANSSIGKNIIPRLAAVLNYQAICDVTEILDATTFKRPIYAGNAIATIGSQQKLNMITVRPSSFSITKQVQKNMISPNIPIKQVQTSEVNDDIKWESDALLDNDKRPDLTSAKTVITGGVSLKDKEHFESLLDPLANTLNAAVGATRAAVDGGFCDNSLQIGQTGKIVAPDLYVAIGVSGAIQHLAGMKGSKVVVAINKDADAPIFKVADYGLQGDLFDIVPELTEKLQEMQS